MTLNRSEEQGEKRRYQKKNTVPDPDLRPTGNYGEGLDSKVLKYHDFDVP